MSICVWKSAFFKQRTIPNSNSQIGSGEILLMTKNDTPANVRLNKRHRKKYLWGTVCEIWGTHSWGVFDVLYALIQRGKINKQKTETFRVLRMLRYERKFSWCRINRAEPFLSYWSEITSLLFSTKAVDKPMTFTRRSCLPNLYPARFKIELSFGNVNSE